MKSSQIPGDWFDIGLRVIGADLSALQHLYDISLSTLPGVQKLTFTLVMKIIIENRTLPLG